MSPFSVDSSSSSEYGSPPPKRSRFNSPATSYSPHSESPYGANSMECLNKVTFTITMRRAPRLFVPLSYQSGKKFVVDNSEAGRNKKDITTRQGTASDFVNLIDGAEKRREKDVGPIPVLSEQEIFKASCAVIRPTSFMATVDQTMLLNRSANTCPTVSLCSCRQMSTANFASSSQT